MRALLVEEHGPVETLELAQRPGPQAGPAEVLVDIHAASVNFPDLLVIEGSYQNLPPRPFIPGKDFAGIVADVGPGVTAFERGDRVSAQVEYGAYAEQCIVRACNCQHIPDTMSFVDAAAIGLVYQTAHYALVERGRCQRGEAVLITGAAGGVGLAAVQIAKALGATVVAAVGSSAKAELARANGADVIVRTDVPDLRSAVKAQIEAALGKRGVDLVVDSVGGDLFDACLRTMAWCGRLVIVGFAGGRIPTVKAGYLLVKNISLLGLQWSDYRDREPANVERVQRELFRWYEEGRIKPHVMATYPMRDYRTALLAVRDRKVQGKVVLLPRE